MRELHCLICASPKVNAEAHAAGIKLTSRERVTVAVICSDNILLRLDSVETAIDI
jgi:hypothetical protein